MVRPRYIIAELGIGHDGSRDRWRRMIEAAVEAGADAIKGQWWSSPEAMATHRGGNLELFQRYHMPLEWLEDIPAGVDRMCTVYLPQDVSAVVDRVAKFKVGSWESHDEALLIEYEQQSEKDIVISTGGWSGPMLRSRRREVNRLYLHCISAYPTAIEDVQLGAIGRYDLDGFSDHTGLIRMGGYAALAGAQIIEAHLRHYLTDPQNPDWSVSLDPEAFAGYVRNIREAERCLGAGSRIRSPGERWHDSAS